MEAKTIIYIVIGVLWYIYKFSKKKKKAGTTTEPLNTSDEVVIEEDRSNEPSSFEEMLEKFIAPKRDEAKEIKVAPIVENEPVLELKNKPLTTPNTEFKRFDEYEND